MQASFQTSGTLQDIYVKDGDHVVKGQLLATLDPTAAQLTLNQADQNLTAAQDNLTNAENQPTTSSSATSASLANAGSSTAPTRTTSTTGTTSAETIAANIASAQAAVDSAEAMVHNAENALHQTHLYAPATGTVVNVAAVSPGDAVSAGGSAGSGASGSSSSASSGSSGSGSSSSGAGSGSTAGGLGGSSTSSSSSGAGLIEIVNTRSMTMTVAFSESDISKVKVGQAGDGHRSTPCRVSSWPAHVSSISTLGTTSSSVVSYDATLTLDQSDSRVKPGMSASAAVITGQAAGVTLPNSAVTGTGSLTTVNLLRNGKAVATPVVVGLEGDSRTQIVSGLRAGDQVVVTTTLPALGSGIVAVLGLQRHARR